jgi:secondary thiamine-phosphate synthase enzyme
MIQLQRSLTVRTSGRGLVEITADVAAVVAGSGVQTGLCVVFCTHTSASLLIQENADPSVRADLLGYLERLAPDGDPRYEHDSEGPDDMSAHLRSALTRTSETMPVARGRLALGTWQGLYLLEHRTRPHTRTLVVHVIGAATPLA